MSFHPILPLSRNKRSSTARGLSNLSANKRVLPGIRYSRTVDPNRTTFSNKGKFFLNHTGKLPVPRGIPKMEVDESHVRLLRFQAPSIVLNARSAFSCPNCLKSYNRKHNLNRHVLHECGNYMCTNCMKSYSRKDGLKRHIELECGVPPKFECELYNSPRQKCLKEFASNTNLKRHIEEVCGVTPKSHHFTYHFTCQKCSKQFGRKTHLKRHIEEVCGITAKSHHFTCQKCSKQFTSNKNLKRHIEEVCGVTPKSQQHTCQKCSKQFARKTNLKRHVEKCVVVTPKFACEHCSYRSKRNRDLKVHCEKLHSLKAQIQTQCTRPFTCHHCLKTFARKDNWKRHIKDVCELSAQPRFACLSRSEECPFYGDAHSVLPKSSSLEVSLSPLRPIVQQEGPPSTSSQQSTCGSTVIVVQDRTAGRTTSLATSSSSAGKNLSLPALSAPIGQNTNITSKLTSPSNTRTKQSSYRCVVCGKSYRRKNTLMRHWKFECGKEPQFSCPYCPFKAKHKHNYKQHLIMRHSDECAMIAPSVRVGAFES
ncbi:hypothetical protein GE061_003388 [Apolygus lucorum]|uniref:C2H2-type domain-containing protein n=1 Tax=Apolygus lucorum TaxID=248454 RepID=A0A8S9X1V8_APOLU|nr:hypothetical protein GE061_003388 [Apolygus lucorum]